MARKVLPTDEQWKRIEPLMPKPKRSPKGGRKPIDNRVVFEGILWVLWTGAPWKEVPKRYCSGSTCWRRLKQWEEQGTRISRIELLFAYNEVWFDRINKGLSRCHGRQDRTTQWVKAARTLLGWVPTQI